MSDHSLAQRDRAFPRILGDARAESSFPLPTRSTNTQRPSRCWMCPQLERRELAAAFHPIQSGPSTTSGSHRDYAPSGNTHLTQSGRRSHSCRSANPRSDRSTGRTCLAVKHICAAATNSGCWLPGLLTSASPQGPLFRGPVREKA
jgi:hypothetical protein